MTNLKKTNILIIEDNEDDLFFIKKSIANKGYKLHEITSGTEAFDYLLNPDILPDIILMDNKLPGMDGIEIITKLKNHDKLYCFIFLTIDNTLDTVVKAMKAGALDFIVKSENLKAELPGKIEKVLEISKNKIEKLKFEANLKSLIEAGNDSIWSIDKDYNFIIFNEFFRKVTIETHNVEPKQGISAIEVFQKDIASFWKLKYDKVLLGERLVFEFTTKIENKKEYFEIRLNPIVIENNIEGVSAISTNITNRKKTELKLKEQNEEYEALNEELTQTNYELIKTKEKAEESNRLKTEFLNNMSHEIRTPLNGIMGFSEYLTKADISKEKQINCSNIILNNSKQLLKIIEDILEISSFEKGNIELNEGIVCFNDLLMNLFSVFDLKAKENKTPLFLKKDLPDRESIIHTDENKLKKILTHLIDNAIKYTNEGFIEISYQKTENELEISISDTGIGIDEEKTELIFKRFSQEDKRLSRKFGGLGLGLSLAKENADLIGGSITLKSKKGKGSTFCLTIPYKPVYKKADAGNKNNIDDTTHTILIVEDEEVNYLYFETLLFDDLDFNCKLYHAKNGKEAVNMCMNHPEIEIVLMDLKMPVMDGFDATKHIKKLRNDLPVIAQTAYSTATERKQAEQAGCDDFISKPICEETLNETLNKYLSKKSENNKTSGYE